MGGVVLCCMKVPPRSLGRGDCPLARELLSPPVIVFATKRGRGGKRETSHLSARRLRVGAPPPLLARPAWTRARTPGSGCGRNVRKACGLAGMALREDASVLSSLSLAPDQEPTVVENPAGKKADAHKTQKPATPSHHSRTPAPRRSPRLSGLPVLTRSLTLTHTLAHAHSLTHTRLLTSHSLTLTHTHLDATRLIFPGRARARARHRP